MLCHDLGGYQNIWNPTMSLHSLTTQKAMIWTSSPWEPHFLHGQVSLTFAWNWYIFVH
jgi:uncharacterized membrane protein YdfJ with MMPL/SSD domain